MLIFRLGPAPFCWLILLVFLIGCASRQVASPQAGLTDGQSALSQGDVARDREAEEGKLRSVEQALREASEESDFAELERILSTIRVGVLTDAQKLRRQLAIVRFYLLRDSPDIARRYIDVVSDSFLVNIDHDLQRSWFLAYAEMLEASGDPLSALRMRLLLDERLTAEESAANHPGIFRLLAEMKMEDLFTEAQLAPDLYMRGWYDFAMLFNLDISSARLDPIDHWQSIYRRHPGRRYFDQLITYHRDLPPLHYFDKVAFLLPFSGNLAEISESIYRGYEAMALENLIPWQPIRLDSNQESIPFLLAEARAQGAELIIGPLRKDRVEEASALAARMKVPIIVLNELPSDKKRAANLYSLTFNLKQNVQFALDMAWDDLCRWALLLVDDTDLGLRAAQAIQVGWEEKGGILVKTSLMDRRESVSEQVSQFLEVDVDEVAATKEVYRQYLLILAKLGLAGEEIDDILASNRTVGRTPYVMPRDNKTLLLRDEEIIWLQTKYYEKNFLVEGNFTFLTELASQEERNFSLANAEHYRQYDSEELLKIFKQEMESVYDRAEGDCIFLAMERGSAAQARPYFSFYLSNDMGLYGTFILLDAGLSASAYEDLNQAGYGEMPWLSDLLRDPEAREAAANDSVYTLRYHALGRDTFLVGQSLSRLVAAGGDSPLFLLGHSGILSLGDDGELMSRPRRVFFIRGLPNPPAKRSIFE